MFQYQPVNKNNNKDGTMYMETFRKMYQEAFRCVKVKRIMLHVIAPNTKVLEILTKFLNDCADELG